MNKREFAKELASRTMITQLLAKEIIENALKIIAETVHGGDIVHFQHFGTFYAMQKKERKGVSPVDGKRIIITAKNIFRFRPAKELKIIKQFQK